MKNKVIDMSFEAIEAIKNSIKLWIWLTETGSAQKIDWPGWGWHGGVHGHQYHDCFMCQFSGYDIPGRNYDMCQANCPYQKHYGHPCFEDNQPYDAWRLAQNAEGRKKYAERFLAQLKDLLPEQKFGVGAKVMVMMGDTNKTKKAAEYAHHKGDVGTITALEPHVGCADQWELDIPGAPCKLYYEEEELTVIEPAPPPKARHEYKVGDKVRVVKSTYNSICVGDIGEITSIICEDRIIKVKTPHRAGKTTEEPLSFSPNQIEPCAKFPIRRVYIAGALSSLPDGQPDSRTGSQVVVEYLQNCSFMIEVAGDLLHNGFAPFVPALDLLTGIVDGTLSEDAYRDTSLAWLEVSDAVLVISESTGVTRDVNRAKELGIPVFNTIGEMKRAAR